MMRVRLERCDQCGEFVSECSLVVSGIDESKSICKRCDTKNATAPAPSGGREGDGMSDLERIKKWCQEGHADLSSYGVLQAVILVIEELQSAQPQPAPDPAADVGIFTPYLGTPVFLVNGMPFTEYKAAAEQLAGLVLEPQGSAKMGTFFPPPVSLELRRLAAIVARGGE